MFAAYDQKVQNFHKGFSTRPQSMTEDPTYLGFKFIFDFDPSHRDPQDLMTHDPLFAAANNQHGLESAELYLSEIGYTAKAQMIKAFKENLRYINEVTPYYFQSIEGVNELWKIEKGDAFNSFRGKDKVLTINCLESIDMRITSLADMYRKATFDVTSMRELLPENLRHFSMIIQIAEMRSFHRIKQSVTAEENKAIGDYNELRETGRGSSIELEMVKDLISIIQFKCEFCEFDFDESWPSENISHSEMEMAKQKFKIKIGRIREHNTYSQLKGFNGMLVLSDGYGTASDKSHIDIVGGTPTNPDSLRLLDSQNNELGSAYNNESRYGKISTVVGGAMSDLQKRLENAPGVLVNRAVNAVESRLTGMVLGNVYDDLRNQSLGTILNGFLRKEDQINPAEMGNVYPPLGNQPKLGKEDVYPNVPEPPPTYPDSLGNIYK